MLCPEDILHLQRHNFNARTHIYTVLFNNININSMNFHRSMRNLCKDMDFSWILCCPYTARRGCTNEIFLGRVSKTNHIKEINKNTDKKKNNCPVFTWYTGRMTRGGGMLECLLVSWMPNNTRRRHLPMSSVPERWRNSPTRIAWTGCKSAGKMCTWRQKHTTDSYLMCTTVLSRHLMLLNINTISLSLGFSALGCPSHESTSARAKMGEVKDIKG